jgi:hypothetical protein
MKFFAYAGGAHVLDAVLDYFRDPEPAPDGLTGIGPARLARLRLHLLIRAAILGRCVPDDDPRALAVGQLSEILDEKRGRGGPPPRREARGGRPEGTEQEGRL